MAKTQLETARELDLQLKEAVARARRAEAEVAAALLEMKERGLFRFLGYSRIQDYAEAALDLARGKTKDLIEVAMRARGLPRVRAAFESGELPWTKARQVVRIATPESEEEWLEAARTLTNRALERRVAEARGEEPVVRITLELTPAEAADIEEAVRRVREERGAARRLGSDVAEIARRSMGPPVDRPGYQVVIHECPTCGAASRDARDGPIEVAPEDLAAAKVDAEVLDLRGGGTGTARKTIAPAERRAVIARDRGRCVLCGTRAWLHIHHIDPPDGDPGALCLLCSACHERVVHGGHVTIEGRAPALVFRLRDGSEIRRDAG